MTGWPMAALRDGLRRRGLAGASSCSVGDGDDDIRGFDDGGDLAALGQAELADRLDRDGGDQAHPAGLKFHVGDRFASVDARDPCWDLVPRTELHEYVSRDVIDGANRRHATPMAFRG